MAFTKYKDFIVVIVVGEQRLQYSLEIVMWVLCCVFFRYDMLNTVFK